VSKRYARVVVRSVDGASMRAFLMQRAFDVGGRPQHVKQGWVVEVYLPEDECEGLAAEGCEFRIDRAYFDRLHQDHQKEQARRPSKQELDALLKSGRFPSCSLDEQGRLKGFE
jgi:hypothetical protein